jgi:short-subunit dehydrogenase
MVDEVNTYRSVESRMLAKTIPKLPAEKVADEIVKGIEKNQYEITPGIVTRIAAKADKLFPSIGRAVVDFKISRIYKGPEN